MMNTSLSGFAARRVRQTRPLFAAVQACAGRLGAAALSPRCRSAARCGQEDAALAAGRPLLGCPGLGRAHFVRSASDQ